MSSNARRKAITGLLALALAGGCGLPLWGQSTFGTILGSVLDAKGGAIPGVEITLTDEGTNVVRTTKTNEAGIFEFVDLVAGFYRLEVRQEGFKTFVQEGIELSSRQTIRIDPVMDLGAVVETVTVRPVPGLIETETGAISATVLGGMPFFLSPSTISQRPWDQMRLDPLVQSTSSATRFTMAGLYHSQSEFQVDGIIVPLGAGGWAGSMTMSSEAIAEMKILAVNNSAEYASPAVTLQISKYGINRCRGDVFYNFDSSVLNARRADRSTKTGNHNNRFGGNIGGPIRVPKLYNGRDKTFFSLSWQSLRAAGGTAYSAAVPTTNMRAGIFTSTIRDPLTGQPFLNRTIPDLRINEVSRRIQNLYYPLPTIPERTTNNYQVDGPNGTTREEVLDLRIDQHINSRHWMFARVGGTQFNLQGYDTGLDTLGNRANTRKLYTGTLSYTWTARPTLLNELRLGFVRDNSPGGGSNNGLTVLKTLGIEFPADMPPPDARGFPVITITGVQTLMQQTTAKNIPATYQLTDTVSWMNRRHTFKGGINIFAEQPNIRRIPSGAHGNFWFTGTYTTQAYADFLLGIPDQTRVVGVNPPMYMRSTNYGLFFQDDYKAPGNLTLNLGLRWDYQGPIYNKNDALYNFDLASGSLIKATPNTPVNAAFRTRYPRVPIVEASAVWLPEGNLHFADLNDFAPRIGFAWRPRGTTNFAIRGGWGKFTDLIGQGVFQLFAGGGNGAFLTYGENVYQNDRLDRNLMLPATAWSFPFPFPSAHVRETAPSLTASGFNPRLANPYVQQWNLTVERVLAGAGLRASYVASKSTNLIYRRDVNQRVIAGNDLSRPYANLGFGATIDYMDNGGSHIYHALQVKADRRLPHGPMILGGYVWGNNISDVIDGLDQDYFGVGSDARSRRNDRGRVGYGRQHNLTAMMMWSLPFGRTQRFLGHPGWLRRVAGGWQLYPQFLASSGAWFTPRRQGANPFTGIIDETARADRMGDGNDGPRLAGSPGKKWINVSAFTQPAANLPGNAGRNILEGPGSWNLHLSLTRSVRFKERKELLLTISGQNILNHTNWMAPSGAAELTVGQAAFGNISTSGAARAIVLRSRINF